MYLLTSAFLVLVPSASQSQFANKWLKLWVNSNVPHHGGLEALELSQPQKRTAQHEGNWDPRSEDVASQCSTDLICRRWSRLKTQNWGFGYGTQRPVLTLHHCHQPVTSPCSSDFLRQVFFATRDGPPPSCPKLQGRGASLMFCRSIIRSLPLSLDPLTERQTHPFGMNESHFGRPFLKLFEERKAFVSVRSAST